ncbi:uncharacterized protein LOC135976220 [Chrysemys picta bellii]|uniref:uncharacterized protein LOC135976220 n=1 Tax=Chrysemys picta bellii TaxID=8478 RepID=UPI0032B10D39
MVTLHLTAGLLPTAEPSYPKPNISLLSPSRGVSLGGSVAIQCRAQRQGVRFVLNKDGHHFQPVDSAGFEVVFPISNVSREHGGSYSCSYHSRSEPFAVSYPSDPVELVVRGKGAAPRPSSSGRGVGSSRCGWGVKEQGQYEAGWGALWVCWGISLQVGGYDIYKWIFPFSTSPSGVLKVPAQQDPDYASIDEEKETQTLEPDPGTEGLTYAELDGQALQAKPGGPAPAPEPVLPSMYAAINVSRGAPQ